MRRVNASALAGLVFVLMTMSPNFGEIVAGGTISFTPVPPADLSQPFLPGTAPTVFEVRLASATATTIGSIDVVVGSPLDGGSAVSIPNVGGFVLAPSFVASFFLNSVRHPGQLDGGNPYVLSGSYTEGFKFGGFAFVPQSTSAGILLGTMTIAPLTDVGLYTFGVSSAVDGNFSKLASGSIPIGQIETLYGSVVVRVQTAHLVVAPFQRDVAFASGMANFSVSNTGAGQIIWTAQVVSTPWMRIAYGSSGVNGGIIFLAYDANPDPGPRTGVIRVSSPGASPPFVDVTVTQAGTAPPPTVSHFEFDPLPGPYMVNEPIPVTIRAFNASTTATGQQNQTTFNGCVTLSTNSSALVSPSTLCFAEGEAFGNLLLDLGFSSTVLRANGVGLSGESNPFAVTDDRSGTISGQILGPLTGQLQIGIRDQTGAIVASPSAPFGLFTASALMPGWYTVHATNANWRSLTKTVAVRADDTVFVSLKLFDSTKAPVLLVGGMLGSRETGQAWFYPVITGEPGSPDPSQLELIDKASSPNVWQPLRNVLEPHFTTIDVPWDWRARLDDATVAKYLAPVIDEAKGVNDKVYVVAHSTGGLLVRKYIQSDLYPQRADIEAFAMVATPNQGAAILYYIWEGADPKRTDSVPHPDTDLYSETIGKVFKKTEGLTLYDGDRLRVPHIKLWQFIRQYFPMAGDLMMTKHFLLRDGREYPALDVPSPRVLEDLRTSDTRFRMVAGDANAPEQVRTKLFLSNSAAAEHTAVRWIRVGPAPLHTGIYADGAPDSGDPLRGRGDGTVLYYDLAAIGLSHLGQADAQHAGKHVEMMGVYANEICEFLNSRPCGSTATTAGEARSSVLALAFEGRVQPHLADPTGEGTGVLPGLVAVEHEIVGSSLEIALTQAAIAVDDPVDGAFVVEVAAVSGDVFAVNIRYTSEDDDGEIGFQAIYHGSVIAFGVNLDSRAKPTIVLDEPLGRPTNVRSQASAGLTQLVWAAADDTRVTGYNLYARPDDQLKFTLLGTTTGTTFDTGHPWVSQGVGTLWNYFVVAVNAEGTESFFDTVVQNQNLLVGGMAADVTNGLEPLAVQFRDASAGEVTAWAWDFESDGVIDSTEQNPAHTYTSAGSYTVSLTVGGPEGTDTTIRPGFLTVEPLEPPPPPIPGDYNGDGIVDLLDHAALVPRLTGPFVDPTVAGWHLFDLDPDYDVDLRDFGLFQTLFQGD